MLIYLLHTQRFGQQLGEVNYRQISAALFQIVLAQRTGGDDHLRTAGGGIGSDFALFFFACSLSSRVTYPPQQPLRAGQ